MPLSEMAVEEAKKAMAIDPSMVFSYENLATAFQFLDRLEEAQTTFDRADELKLELPEAKAAYRDFLTLWKDADPDVPILKQARAEFAKLQ
jgi:Tfp pilus assembly protein PilF